MVGNIDGQPANRVRGGGAWQICKSRLEEACHLLDRWGWKSLRLSLWIAINIVRGL